MLNNPSMAHFEKDYGIVNLLLRALPRKH